MDISEKVGLAAELACLLEASAEKTGNVTPAHDFDDMKYTDFLISAAAAGRAFRNSANSSVGEIILNAVKDITRLTNVNTSLGIILLLAPLAKGPLNSTKHLRENVKTALKTLTI
ncbi:MAG: hypothetical protein GX846_10670 [Deltaproteobacteria bacterium]|nr:hypothetical protein [Deltaproteobacteria bacterium]